ncbi:MAG: DNA topoisomerase III, partial [Candidatus Accumulibacter sp.]|nr:DNA topoisomerase III [Accumulibacter sp.]
MSKKLIITEKPSVAADIARALGGFARTDDYFENDDYVVASAVGHLLELACPEEYEVKRGKWSFAHLPVIPPHFTLQPIAKTETRLKLLIRLIKRKDVLSLVNACDAGREGELIFNYIVKHAKADKPVERLWLQSMTPQAIRDGFSRLRDGSEMQGLADAAVCRSESDWLVGINGTRAMTAFNSKTGGFHLTTVGRVQTPTLALIVDREDRIRRFKPREYWELEGVFACAAGDYRGKWFDENFKSKDDDEHARADRLWDQAKAQAIQEQCLGQPGQVSEETKSSTQLSPLLYDLTSLQREANSRFGFSAKSTLALAQALYEKHKVLTYPRTDSRALPEDYRPTVSSTLAMLTGEALDKGRDELLLARYAPLAQQILDRQWVQPNKRI